MRLLASLAVLAALAACSPAPAPPAAEEPAAAPEPAAPTQLTVPMTLVTATGAGASVGQVTITQGPGGASFALALTGLPPGPHGFHVHENASCDPGPNPEGTVVATGGAGAHYDPAVTGKHLGPEGAGHLGDLPHFEVAADGSAAQTLLAPNIKDIAPLQGRALMIHAGGDNYSDTPAPLGGGGARIACGVIR